MGLAGIFAFDLFLYADAMLYSRIDPDIWVARGIANALVIPFVAISTVRNTGWTIEMHMSRTVVFHSTALLLSGVALIAIAWPATTFARSAATGGGAADWLIFAGVLGRTRPVVGLFRSRLRVFVSKHFFSYRYDTG
jgi:hypothetical protein